MVRAAQTSMGAACDFIALSALGYLLVDMRAHCFILCLQSLRWRRRTKYTRVHNSFLHLASLAEFVVLFAERSAAARAMAVVIDLVPVLEAVDKVLVPSF